MLMRVGMGWECFCSTGTAGALVFRGVGLAIKGAGTFESLLHPHIQYTKPLISKEVRGFVVSGVWILLAAQ
jgi:hypothetical protein